MADATLNANPLVARWHASAQRPGFKFLVVQIVCSLAGGPQLSLIHISEPTRPY